MQGEKGKKNLHQAFHFPLLPIPLNLIQTRTGHFPTRSM
ncbi:hypothetical protein GXM_05017 [Nostoc sphaeroides CCNUC1]|uniref:Uncharacterized protein n=1 Tax=Nostoc sphaeroides CCNUC1 TaxID=2653204 RepID=A0A5P8W464_9NOSO|nr:hypothetical protein GXM_05017 [Nostoc sphaeroides CCNUC1]